MQAVIFNLLEVFIVLVPILLAVAFMTIIERKVLAAMQRRVGPNKVLLLYYKTNSPTQIVK
jgi:NADH:ubiquinone oxidoreductase subunit H